MINVVRVSRAGALLYHLVVESRDVFSVEKLLANKNLAQFKAMVIKENPKWWDTIIASSAWENVIR